MADCLWVDLSGRQVNSCFAIEHTTIIHFDWVWSGVNGPGVKACMYVESNV